MQNQDQANQLQNSTKQLIQISQMVKDLTITRQIKIKAQSKTIAKLAVDDTIILTHPLQNSRSIIAYYNSHGTLLSNIEVEHFINLTMLNDHQVLILCGGQQHNAVIFTLWDLQTQKLVKFSVEQLKAVRYAKKVQTQIEATKHTMNFFSRSNLFVYSYTYPFGIQVFYFKLPLTESCDPFHIFDFNFHENKYTAKVVKINELSKIAFIPIDSHNSRIFFTTYSLHKDSPKPLSKYSFEYLAQFAHSIGRIEQMRLPNKLKITDICELKSNIFYIQIENMQSNQELGQYYNLYYSTKINKMIKSKLDQVIKGSFRIQFIEYLRQNIQVYEKRKKENGFRNIPILYISQSTEQILSFYTPPENTLGNIRIHWPKYKDSDNILQYQYNYFEARLDIKIKMPSPVWLRSFFSTFFLLEKDHETDEDLLEQVHQFIKEGHLQTQKEIGRFQKIGQQIERLTKEDRIGNGRDIEKKRQELMVLRQFAFRQIAQERIID